MQRPKGKTRHANAEEKRYQGWLKEHPCVMCGQPGPSIVEHCRGSTFRQSKELVGHWYCISLCPTCDSGHKKGNYRLHNGDYVSMSELWYGQVIGYSEQPPDEVVAAIMSL